MTFRIPTVLLVGVPIILIVLLGSFLMSYAVFEWRHDDGASDGGLTLESLDERIDGLDGSLNNLDGRVDSVSSRGSVTVSIAPSDPARRRA